MREGGKAGRSEGGKAGRRKAGRSEGGKAGRSEGGRSEGVARLSGATISEVEHMTRMLSLLPLLLRSHTISAGAQPFAPGYVDPQPVLAGRGEGDRRRQPEVRHDCRHRLRRHRRPAVRGPTGTSTGRAASRSPTTRAR